MNTKNQNTNNILSTLKMWSSSLKKNVYSFSIHPRLNRGILEMSYKKYDLEERTAIFAEKVIELSKKVSKNTTTLPILNQLLRSATSIGANYMEANGASSKKDFKNKVCICRKEARETKHWLRLLTKADQNFTDDCRNLWKEAQELKLIFSKIALNTI